VCEAKHVYSIEIYVGTHITDTDRKNGFIVVDKAVFPSQDQGPCSVCGMMVFWPSLVIFGNVSNDLELSNAQQEGVT
jgi:hypothetical protein